MKKPNNLFGYTVSVLLFALLQGCVTMAGTVEETYNYDIGEQYYTSDGLEKDYKKSVKYFEEYIDWGRGSSSSTFEAKYKVALMYTYGGYGLEPNQVKAAKIFLSINSEDCYAYQSENKEAWTDINYELGKIHENAITTKKDIRKAKKCYAVAAKNGNEEAALAVNQVDRNEANRKATKSSASTGEKLKQEAKENKPILAKAEAGDPSAQYSMGYKYLAGIGVSANATEAAAWFNKSAKQGGRDAQAYLGFAYSTGTGVTANNATAIEWFQKAANQGHRMASNQLHAVFGHPKYKNPGRPSVEGIGQQAGIALCGNLARVVRDNYRFSIFEEDLTVCRVDDRTMTADFSDDSKLVFDKVYGKMHITGFTFGLVQKICMDLSTDQRCKYISY